MKAREKPIIFDVYRWFGEETEDVKIKKYENNNFPCDKCSKSMNSHGHLETKTCSIQVCEGDWIFKAPNGDMFAIAADVFQEFYEFI